MIEPLNQYDLQKALIQDQAYAKENAPTTAATALASPGSHANAKEEFNNMQSETEQLIEDETEK